MDHISIHLIALIAWLIVFLPAPIYFLSTGLRKFHKYQSFFRDPDFFQEYFRLYCPTEKLSSSETLESLQARFEKNFKRKHGFHNYVFPWILIGMVSGIGICLITRHVMISWFHPGQIKAGAYLFPLFNPIALYAFLGAYMWVAYDQIARLQNKNFSQYNLYQGCYRFLFAIPIGFAFSYLLESHIAPAVVFFLGAFPVSTIMKYGRRLVQQNLKLGDNEENSHSDLEQLQCVNTAQAERFFEEGVETVLMLAYTDPVDISKRANFDFNYALDGISQALLWIYLGERMNKDGKDKAILIRSMGLRGSVEAISLFEAVKAGNADSKVCFAEIAKVLEISEAGLTNTFIEVTEDPYAKFVYKMWGI
ncbi:MAG TPA: hypothetical protein VJ385_21790 [Fibrobacteria bacterium]|nr:hypothetical protein [Fibrobacteria bacterium]